MLKMGAQWYWLLVAMCFGSLATATSETCSQADEPAALQCEDYREHRGAVQLLQREKSHRLGESATVPGHLPDLYIDLDLPPRDRFREWARWMVSAHGPDDPRLPMVHGKRRDPLKFWMNVALTEEEQLAWVEVVKNTIHSDQIEELVGIEEEYAIAMQALGKPLPWATTVDEMLLQSILYELEYPTMGCSGILVALPNGTVVHGRNMDYFLYGMKGNNNSTQKVIFMRGGKPFYTSIALLNPVGVHTAMRFGGWSVEVNTHEGNKRSVNLQSGKAGGKISSWTLRHLLDTVPDYETALLRMRETMWAAPHYLIVAGARPNEGAVLTIHRANPADSYGQALYPRVMVMERKLSPATGVWYMAQTNDEAWGPPMDDRRPFEQSWLEGRGPGNVTAENVLELIRTRPARQNATLFSFVMVPATNFSKLIISEHVRGI